MLLIETLICHVAHICQAIVDTQIMHALCANSPLPKKHMVLFPLLPGTMNITWLSCADPHPPALLTTPHTTKLKARIPQGIFQIKATPTLQKWQHSPCPPHATLPKSARTPSADITYGQN